MTEYTLLPIILAAKRGNWHRFKTRKRNKKFLEIATKIFARDDNRCRYCALQIDKYLSVVNHDGNYSNNQEDNLVTACSLCAQCFFIDSIGNDKQTGGTIIYLPEISQADLNHFCRVLFSSMLRDAPYRGKLQTSYMSLKDRAEAVEQAFGPETSDPNTLGQALLDSNFSQKTIDHPNLKSLRLLADKNSFTKETIYWKKTIFDQIPL